MTSSSVWLFRDHLVYATSNLTSSRSDSPVYEMLITGDTGGISKSDVGGASEAFARMCAPGEWPAFKASMLVDVMVYPGTALSQACRGYLAGQGEAALPGQQCKAIAEQAAALAAGSLTADAVFALTDGLRQYLFESSPKPSIDKRVQELASSLSDAPFRRVRLAPVAKRLGISVDYLRHQFAAQIGISARRYVSFWRNIRAAEAVASLKLPGGRAVTDLVAEGRYTDNSHMNKIFNKYFGGTTKTLFAAMPVVYDGRSEQTLV